MALGKFLGAGMASILKFVARTAQVRQRMPAEGGVEAPCQIVIFPGVRRERSGEDGGKPTPGRKRGRRRRSRSN